MMRRLLVCFLTIVCISGCGSRTVRTVSQGTSSSTIAVVKPSFEQALSSEEPDDLAKAVENLSWKEFVEKMKPLTDTLIYYALDSVYDHIGHRLLAQKYGSSLMTVAMEKWQTAVASGEVKTVDEWSNDFYLLADAVRAWYRAPNCVCRDQYCVSNKSAKKPVENSFELIVTLPTSKEEPHLIIVYPDNAIEDVLSVAFSNAEYLDEAVFDDDDIVIMEYRKPRNEKEGTPMSALAGKDVVDKMLSNHFMFILYASSDTPDGDPGEEESVCVNLDPFKKIWAESQ